MARNKRKQGDGTMRLRKDGRWEGRIVVEYDENGIPKDQERVCQNESRMRRKTQSVKGQARQVGGTVQARHALRSMDRFLVSNLLSACASRNDERQLQEHYLQSYYPDHRAYTAEQTHAKRFATVLRQDVTARAVTTCGKARYRAVG